MKKLTTFFYITIIVILIGVFFFYKINREEAISVCYLLQRDQNDVQFDSNVIEKAFQKTFSETNHTVKYCVNSADDFFELESKLKETIKALRSDIIFCKFNDESIYSKFISEDSLVSPLYITLSREQSKLRTNKKIVNLYPPQQVFSEAVNHLFKLTPEMSLLLITNKPGKSQNEDFTVHLRAQLNIVWIDENEEDNIVINTVAENLSELNPDYLMIDMNEKNTVGLLEKIVGYPREKIILLIENTSQKVGYYTGTNSHGVNGLTLFNPSQFKNYNNELALLEMASYSLASCYLENQKINSQIWQNHIITHPDELFFIKEDHIMTPIYRVSFTPDGLKMTDKYIFED